VVEVVIQISTGFNRFLTIAIASACETEYLLILSKDLKYITIEKFNELNSEVNTVKKKI
jgi:four helix bundle protein|tara:strand:+ start:27413 stop:27589 length:177 start_codon:yes stop_codon:yes gene_type:complete